MSNTIGTVFRSWWHTMTSYDRHSTLDSPYRSGRHAPLNHNERLGVLTSVATASESRADVSSSYHDDHARASTAMMDTSYGGPGSISPLPRSPAPSRPYSPGLRSASAQRTKTIDGFEVQSPTGEIPMQAFHDGLPPPPPVSHSWARIDRWAEDNYPELYDQLCEGCTINDLNELEQQLDCSLPQDVRESLQIHDGQERGGLPTGIIFGSMLLDCEEMVQEWENWRKVNQEFLLDTSIVKPSVPSKALGGTGQASSSRGHTSMSTPSSPQIPTWRQDLLARQDSVPPFAIQKAYAHPGWIPLVRDWGGNNLAVDLAPGPKGQWGQIILFGRDYDTKYVVARSWSAFIALVADDLNSGKWFVDEETNELKLQEFKKARVEPAYFDILRWRMDQKFGRRNLHKRKSTVPGGASSPTGTGSPYASPVEAQEPRGRSLQRLGGTSPMSSPIRPVYGRSSPLARVAEEVNGSSAGSNANGKSKEILVEVDTPRVSGEENVSPDSSKLTHGTVPDTPKSAGASNSEAVMANGKQPAMLDEESMKTIEI